jgi:tetratricopeptide (TPR) repeat protein
VDQFSAHLDRGWDLAQRGDAHGAAACARQALDIDPDSPEGHNLLGYATALGGDAEEALGHYRHAIALDETYFEAMLNASELLVPLGEFDEAISMTMDAETLAETAEEKTDCILLRVDALLSKGDDAAAKAQLARVPEGPYANPMHAFLVGRAYVELGAHAKARPLLEDAVTRDANNADAHYYLGLALEDSGNQTASGQEFLKTRLLDGQRPPAPWSPTHLEFEAMVAGALAELDPALSRHLRQARVHCVDLPGCEWVIEGLDPRAPVMVDRRDDTGDVRVFVYMRNLERSGQHPEAMQTELHSALQREVAQLFGDSKADIAELN